MSRSHEHLSRRSLLLAPLGLVGTSYDRDRRGKYLIEDIYRDLSPDALQQLSDYHSQVNPLNLSLSNVRGFQGTGAMVVLAQQSLAATGAFDFTNITQNFKHLRLTLGARGTSAADLVDALMRYNADAGAIYSYDALFTAHTSTSVILRTAMVDQTSQLLGGVPGTTAAASSYSVMEAVFPLYSSAFWKGHICWRYALAVSNGQTIGTIGGTCKNTDPIRRIQVFPLSGSFAAGSVATLYAHN